MESIKKVVFQCSQIALTEQFILAGEVRIQRPAGANLQLSKAGVAYGHVERYKTQAMAEGTVGVAYGDLRTKPLRLFSFLVFCLGSFLAGDDRALYIFRDRGYLFHSFSPVRSLSNS
jgi:hypothetical protein